MDINENILLNILNIIKDDNKDTLKNIKILNAFYENELPLSNLKEEYNNIEIFNFKLEDCDINSLLNYKDEKFDYIILVDVIEKLRNPNEFINNIKDNINSQGKLICNSLNLMNRSVVKNMLGGKFTYSDSGILNKSNLRFFTLNEINALLDKEGYDLKQILAIVTNSTKEEDDFVKCLCDITNEGLKLNYNTYSYIISTSPKVAKTLYDYVLND